MSRWRSYGLDKPVFAQMPPARFDLAIVAVPPIAGGGPRPDDTKRRRPGAAGLIAVQVVRTIAITHAFAVGTPRHLDVAQERVARIAVVDRGRDALVRGTAAPLTDLAAEAVAACALVVARVVAVEHGTLLAPLRGMAAAHTGASSGPIWSTARGGLRSAR
jgi:hypothetical protein